MPAESRQAMRWLAFWPKITRRSSKRHGRYSPLQVVYQTRQPLIWQRIDSMSTRRPRGCFGQAPTNRVNMSHDGTSAVASRCVRLVEIETYLIDCFFLAFGHHRRIADFQEPDDAVCCLANAEHGVGRRITGNRTGAPLASDALVPK